MTRPWQTGTFRNLPLWLAVTAINASVLFGFLFWKRATQGSLDGSLAPLLAIFWLAVAIYLLLGKPAVRAHPLDLTLPIPTRELWRRHWLGTLLGALLVLAAVLAMLAVHVWLLARLGRGTALELPILALVGPLLAATVLATALIDGIEPGLWKPRTAPHYWPRTLVRLAAVLVLLLASSRWPLFAVSVCIALSIVVVQRQRKRLPAAYRLVPTRALDTRTGDARSPAANAAALVAARTRPVSRWQVWHLVFSVLHTTPPWKRFAPWLLYVFVALMGFLLSGGPNRWIDAAELRFLYLPFGSYMLLAGFGLLTYHLFRLDPLPIPRRTLFAASTVPGLVIFCLGYGAGLLTVVTDPHASPSVTFRYLAPRVKTPVRSASDEELVDHHAMVWVEVDPGFMGVALSGEVPTLTSPWGESHPAWSDQLLRGLPIRVYSPYNTADEASADFEAWLASRAVETTFGRSLPYREIRDRYLVVDGDRVTGLQGPQIDTESGTAPGQERDLGRDLLTDHPDVEAPRSGPETPIYLVIALVPWLLLTAFIVRSFRASHSNRYIRWMYWIALGLLMGVLLLQVLLGVFGLFSLDAARTILAVSIQRLGTTPLLWASTWLLGLGLIAAAYRLALTAFERAEIPARPINCSWIDWEARS